MIYTGRIETLILLPTQCCSLPDSIKVKGSGKVLFQHPSPAIKKCKATT